ncbi:HAD family hydrolase [Cerasicoccus fimbriatus]|uniref:HAD family hydrolase n=1 Tax=Cerasicoccus fimbriatus TaxID=3014554 RepID=UPI0022B550B3|nr:HAD family hydrolase [Cerasicoccus sp. TK19100]
MALKLKPVDIIRNNSPEMEPVPTGQSPKLKKLKGIRAVMFDIYGTLFQSGVGDISLVANDKSKTREKLIRQSIEEVGFILTDEKTPINELFMDTIKAEQDIRRDQGTPFPEVDIIGVWEDLIGQLEAYELIRGRTTRNNLMQLATLFEVRVNPVYPMPGVLDVFESCLDKGKSLGLISNAQAFTPLLFDAFFEDSPHDLGMEELLCIYSYEHSVAKPGAGLYEIAMERMQALDGIKPEETLFIGNDIRNDIWPAQKLGFKTALFAGDDRSLRLREDDADCKDVKPDAVITELEQIPELLG